MRIFSNDPNFVFFLEQASQTDMVSAAKAAQQITDKLKEMGKVRYQSTFGNAQAMIKYADAL